RMGSRTVARVGRSRTSLLRGNSSRVEKVRHQSCRGEEQPRIWLPHPNHDATHTKCLFAQLNLCVNILPLCTVCVFFRSNSILKRPNASIQSPLSESPCHGDQKTTCEQDKQCATRRRGGKSTDEPVCNNQKAKHSLLNSLFPPSGRVVLKQ